MQRTLTSELKSKIGKKVLLKGWMYTIRNLSNFSFLILRDKDGLAQCVIEDPKELAKLDGAYEETVLEVTGVVKEEKRSKLGVEIIDCKLNILSKVQDKLPLEINKPEIKASPETFYDNRALVLRKPEERAIFKIQAELVDSYRRFLRNNGFTEFFSPTLAGQSSEGGAEVFKLDYFGKAATLVQSAQLYKQIMAGVWEGAYSIGHVYRAEKHATNRHLTESIQYEFEVAFINDIYDILDWEEKIVRYMISELIKNCEKEIGLLEEYGYKMVKPTEKPFPRMTLQEALELYYKRTKIDDRKEPDLSPEAEREMCKWAVEETGAPFVFVTHYPLKKVAFYAMPSSKHKDMAEYGDLLCNGAEVTSGGQRRHTYELMVEGLVSKGLNPENFEGYLQIFKYGMPPHGGFALGVERFTQMLFGFENIRRTSLFYRDLHRLTP